MFAISICFSIATGIFYAIFASGELQPWAKQDTSEHQITLNKWKGSSSSSPIYPTDRVTNELRAEIDK
jgi:hypothetical protein